MWVRVPLVAPISMRKILCLVTLLVSLTPALGVVTNWVHLAWCPSADTNVTSYVLYWGVGNVTNWMGQVVDTNFPPCRPVVIFAGSNWFRAYTTNMYVGNVTDAYVSNLVVGATYYFSVTARNGLGLESDYSNEARYSATNRPPNPLLNLRFR